MGRDEEGSDGWLEMEGMDDGWMDGWMCDAGSHPSQKVAWRRGTGYQVNLEPTSTAHPLLERDSRGTQLWMELLA